jgi:hypothetical protein
MSEKTEAEIGEGELYQSIRIRCFDRVCNEMSLSSWKPEGGYMYGFHEGWHEALNTQYDGRSVLMRQLQVSKHQDCPCTKDSRCNHSCPHGLAMMSGSCHWCDEAYREIEAVELTPKV